MMKTLFDIAYYGSGAAFLALLVVGSYLNYRRAHHPAPLLRTVPNEDLEKTKGGPVEIPKKTW